VLLIVVDQDEKAALVVIEGIDAHQFSRTSSRGNQRHPNLVRAWRFRPTTWSRSLPWPHETRHHNRPGDLNQPAPRIAIIPATFFRF
jgi:hypothetical protein